LLSTFAFNLNWRRYAEARTTGTPEHLVIAADALVMGGGAPAGAKCVWINVDCATPVDPDTVPVHPDGTAAAVTEVPEELSFRTPYFFPGANGGWAAEGDDPAPPDRPGRGVVDPR